MLIKRHFKSATALWEHVLRDPIKVSGYSYRGGPWTNKPEYDGFYGTKDHCHASELATNGWPDGAKQARLISDAIKGRIGRYIATHEPVYDVVGETPDVGAFLSGEPSHMVSFSVAEKEARIVTIAVNSSFSGGIGSDTIMRRGATLCAMIDAIEASGTRTELIAAFGACSGDTKYVISGVVKTADEPLNIDRVAFITSHPSACRRIMARGVELEPKEFRHALGCDTGSFHCSPLPITGEIYADIIFDDMTHGDRRWSDDKSAVKAAVEEMKKSGIEIREEF